MGRHPTARIPILALLPTSEAQPGTSYFSFLNLDSEAANPGAWGGHHHGHTTALGGEASKNGVTVTTNCAVLSKLTFYVWALVSLSKKWGW